MTIVAECGQNHCGDMRLAERLIREAKRNGADLVKFQLYDHKKLYSDNPKVPNVELSKAQATDLFIYGREIGIEVFFSVFDVERVDWCEAMGIKRYKIACSQNNNRELADVLFPIGKEIIISRCESDRMILFGFTTKHLFCPSGYPAKVVGMPDFSDSSFEGFSDHTIGLDAAKIAFARGASIVEKHFAIDHKTGIDAPWSMTPDELAELKRFETICKDVL